MLYSSAIVPLDPTVSLISCANTNWRYQSDNIKRRCLWKCCLNTYLKNFATSPCYHAVITWFFRCLHLLINSDLLLSRLFPSYEFISSFSFKQKKHFLLLKLYDGHFLPMLQDTFGIKLLLLIFQYFFNSSVSHEQSSWVKDLVCCRIIEWFFCNSKVNFFSEVRLKLSFPSQLYLAINISHLKDNTSYSAVAAIFIFLVLMENVHAMILYDWLDVLHAAITHFNFISIKHIANGVDLGKWVFLRCKKHWPILVMTFTVWWIKTIQRFIGDFCFCFPDYLC